MEVKLDIPAFENLIVGGRLEDSRVRIKRTLDS